MNRTIYFPRNLYKFVGNHFIYDFTNGTNLSPYDTLLYYQGKSSLIVMSQLLSMEHWGNGVAINWELDKWKR